MIVRVFIWRHDIDSRGMRPLSHLLSSHPSCQHPSLACDSRPHCDVSPSLCLNRSVPRGPEIPQPAIVWVSKSQSQHIPAYGRERAHTHTHTRTQAHAPSIGVQSGKGPSVVLCEWPLLKQINRHWHVPPPTGRKQLKAIDPVPGSSMNMHVSLTFPCRRCSVGGRRVYGGGGKESDRQM